MKCNFILLLVIAILSNGAWAQEKNVHDAHLNEPSSDLKILLGEDFMRPLVSPDFHFALATKEERGGLFLIDLHTNNVQLISEDPASSYGYSWDRNSEKFYFLKKGDNEYLSQSDVYTYSIEEGKEFENIDDISSLYLPSFTGFDDSLERQLVVYTDALNLEIMAVDLQNREEWKVSDGKRRYFSPILSNDQTKVAVLSDDGVYVFPVEGGEAIKVGDGIVTQWSADDSYLLGFEDYSEDGHDISKSDIFTYDANRFAPIQLTHTDDVVELYPTFYKDNQLLCTDSRSGKIILVNYKR